MRTILAVIAVFLLAITAPATAGKAKPYLTVTPSPLVAPSPFTLSGCGYKAGDAYVTVWHNPVTGGYSGQGTVGYSQETDVEADGCVSFSYSTMLWGDLAGQRGAYMAYITQERGSVGVNYLVVTFTVG